MGSILPIYGRETMAKENTLAVDEAIENLNFAGTLIEKKPFGNGHINDTFKLTFDLGNGETKPYILQKVNDDIFNNLTQLMENINGVTSHLRKKIIENGGDPERETLNVVPTKDGKLFYTDSNGVFWRSYTFIEDATCYETVEEPELFYQSAIAFGNFQKLLSDYPAETLHETIVDFHHTPKRFEAFVKAVEADAMDRVKDVKEDIDFILKRRDDMAVLVDMLGKGQLPLRVTHNDTKLNNVMIDDATGKGLCVIDLDTVMPGLSANDFGDSIRFGASTALEDEPDLSKVRIDLELFDIYTKGFIEATDGKLTDSEIDMLPFGAKIITLEQAMRFLMDHIQGDTYFKIHRENHNLDRARTQIKLVADMEEKWDQMKEIVNKYR